jgi:dienelactone hydrolase
MCMLASNEEDAAEVEAFDKALTTEKHIETYETQIHGWMSARGDLKDEAVRKEYERGYKTLLDFFAKHI